MAVAQDGVLREAGDEQHLQAGTRYSRGVRHLAAVDAAGQADVGDKQINPSVGLQNP